MLLHREKGRTVVPVSPWGEPPHRAGKRRAVAERGKQRDRTIAVATGEYFVFHFLLFVFYSTRRRAGQQPQPPLPPPSWPPMMVHWPQMSSHLVLLVVLVVPAACLPPYPVFFSSLFIVRSFKGRSCSSLTRFYVFNYRTYSSLLGIFRLNEGRRMRTHSSYRSI